MVEKVKKVIYEGVVNLPIMYGPETWKLDVCERARHNVWNGVCGKNVSPKT